MILKIEDIINNEYLLSAFGFANPVIEEMIHKLQYKYPNLMSSFQNIDGYAFPSGVFTEESADNRIPLIQINNVNELEYNLNSTQKFVYLPQRYRKEKPKYELKDKCVLVSLTGDGNKEKEISIFYDQSFPAMLNQRVCAFSLKEGEKEDLLYYFYGLSFSRAFKDQWMGNGGVQKNTGKKEKENLYLPHVQEEVIRYIAVLVKALIHKSKMIASLYQQASCFVNDEICGNQRKGDFQYKYPTIKELVETERMDAKAYSHDAKEIEYRIYHYSNGYYTVPLYKIKGGNTPKKRMIAENDGLKYYWITPTIISDIGLISAKHTIKCPQNNIKQNCLLIVNRTSKGADGKYVGMSFFYNVEKLGEGQYNQGIYAIQDYDDEELLYMNAIFNSQIYRKYFGLQSMGSKMKEIKAKQIAGIPIPQFAPEQKKKLIKLYHNDTITYDCSMCNLETFEQYDQQFNQQAGIYELDESMRYMKDKLQTAVERITQDQEIEIEF